MIVDCIACNYCQEKFNELKHVANNLLYIHIPAQYMSRTATKHDILCRHVNKYQIDKMLIQNNITTLSFHVIKINFLHITDLVSKHKIV